jgi:hypothetical protein
MRFHCVTAVASASAGGAADALRAPSATTSAPTATKTNATDRLRDITFPFRPRVCCGRSKPRTRKIAKGASDLERCASAALGGTLTSKVLDLTPQLNDARSGVIPEHWPRREPVQTRRRPGPEATDTPVSHALSEAAMSLLASPQPAGIPAGLSRRRPGELLFDCGDRGILAKRKQPLFDVGDLGLEPADPRLPRPIRNRAEPCSFNRPTIRDSI